MYNVFWILNNTVLKIYINCVNCDITRHYIDLVHYTRGCGRRVNCELDNNTPPMRL